MTLVVGMFCVALSFLLLRGLKIWYLRYGPVGGLADNIVDSLVLPLLVGALVLGSGLTVTGFWEGVSWWQAALGVPLIVAAILAWRALGRLPGPTIVLPLTPKPRAARSRHRAIARTTKKAA